MVKLVQVAITNLVLTCDTVSEWLRRQIRNLLALASQVRILSVSLFWRLTSKCDFVMDCSLYIICMGELEIKKGIGDKRRQFVDTGGGKILDFTKYFKIGKRQHLAAAVTS